MKRKRAFAGFVTLALLAAIGGCMPQVDSASSAPTHLTILHTNDWHGYAFARSEDGQPSGGVAACAAEINRIRDAQPDNVLVLDAGDLLSGHAAVRFEAEGIRGLPFVELWDRIGYDAWVVGNHDLDHGGKNLRRLIHHIHAATLCANLFLRAEDGSAPVPGESPLAVDAKPYQVFERAGIRVGVIGLTTAEMPDLVAEKSFAGLAVLPPSEVLRAWWPEFSAKSDIQIVLSHAGIEADRALAAAFPELEAIVGGHSHTFLEHAEQVGPVLVAQAGCNGKKIGRIDLEIADGRVVSSSSELLTPHRPADAAIDPALLAAEQALSARVQALEKEVIATVSSALGRSYYAPSPLGHMVAAAFQYVAGSEIGFANSGGIRTDLESGPFTQAGLLALLPFDNELVRFDLTGAQLEAVIRHNVAAQRNESHGILQISGMQWKVGEATPAKPQSDAEVVLLELTVDGAPLDPTRVYSCAGSDYITASRAEKYFGFLIEERRGVGLYVRDAFEKAVRDGALPGIVPLH